MNHFISDTHFGHENILKYDGRPFSSIEEHDRVILENINDTLSPDDHLYHLGDVAWDQNAYNKFITGLRKDIGLTMLRGNHDHRIRNGHVQDVFLIKEGPGIWLSHYPHLSWPKSFHGSIHLFGHVHGTVKGVGKSMDVSANMIDYTPISQEKVFEIMKTKEKLSV